MTKYIFEVQNLWNRVPKEKRFQHIGYMNIVFSSKNEAEKFYIKKNPHMQSLNRNKNWCSDWDPLTKNRYILREDNNQEKKIPVFKNTYYIPNLTSLKELGKFP